MNNNLVETDAKRSAAVAERSFHWVFQEITLPSDQAKKALLSTWLRFENSGYSAAVRALNAVWPVGASWPSGERYLRPLGWRPASEVDDDDSYDGPELMELLYGRLSQVCQRMYRDPQVRRCIDPESPNRVKQYTEVIINRYGLLSKDEDPCGYGPDVHLSIAQGLQLMSTPAHQHPACRCTVDPYPV